MGSSTLLMGVLPGYATIGIAAPLCLLVLRFLQGMGVGGEWGGAVLLAMEYGDDRRRGFWASWPQVGVPVALAFTALVVLLFEGLYPGDAFISIGWRMPFLLGAMLVLVALYIRLRIMETPAFVRIQSEQRVSKAPLLDALRYSWRQIILSALLRSGEQAPFYIFTTFMLSYGVETLHMSESLLFFGLTLAALIECVSMPTFSAISDRLGRKRWCLIGTVVMGVYVLPYFLLLDTRNPWLVVLAIVLALPICHAWLYGLQAALIAEQFATPYRYTGASLGYQLASVTAGGPAPLVATYLLANHGPVAPYLLIALYLVALSVVSFISILPLKEYAGKAPAE
jgi:MFS family permease